MAVGVVNSIAALRAQTSGSTGTIYVEGYASLDDGGQGLFIYTPSDTTSADNGGTIIVDSVGDRWHRAFTGAVNVKWFGAKGDGGTDDTAAIQAALNSSTGVQIPAGTYITSAPLNIILDGSEVSGDSSGNTLIYCSNVNFHAFTCADNITLSVLHLRVDRYGTATSGGDGLHFDSPNAVALLYDISCQNQYNGFYLGAMNNGSVQNCTALNNVNHGFTFVPNRFGVGPSQWSPFACVSELNNGDGFNHTNPASGPGTLSISTMTDCSTYANSGHGVAAVGASASHTVAALRIEGGFFGQDNGHEIYLDTFDGGHVIKPTYIELAGSSYNGRNSTPTSGNPPSTTSCGVYVTPNNASTEIVGGVVNGNTFDGVFTSGATTAIVGTTITNNGLLKTNASRQNGVNVFNQTVNGEDSVRSCVITGCTITDTGQGSQQYGIASNIDALAVAGCSLNGNTLSPTALPSNFGAVSSVAGCLPRSVNR